MAIDLAAGQIHHFVDHIDVADFQRDIRAHSTGHFESLVVGVDTDASDAPINSAPDGATLQYERSRHSTTPV
jgi:hypothetical protein